MHSKGRFSRQLGVVSRLVLLAILILALAPVLPAAAEEPDVDALGDVGISASAVAPLEKKVFPAGDDWDDFGASVSISGDVMVAGDPDAWVDGDEDQGAACLFGRNVGGPGNWGLIKKLIADDGDEWEDFGTSVAIYGSTVVVGAPDAGVDGDDERGAAYVFERDAGGAGMWGLTKKLVADDGDDEDYFGTSVAIYGSTIVVGADGADVGVSRWQGAAYVFGRNVGGAGNWGQVKKLVASDGAEDDSFGYSVAIHGATIVVGADDPTVNGYAEAGAAYIFSRDAGGNNNWGEIKKLVAPDPGEGAYFGETVAVHTNTVVVGAEAANVDGNTDQGAVYVFERDLGGLGQWGLRKKLVASDGAEDDEFGSTVAISDATIVVGAHYAEVDGDYEAGAAYVFGRNTTGVNEWGLLTKLTASDGGEEEYFGQWAAIDGATIVVGASEAYNPGAGEYTGAAYVYTPHALRVNSAGPKYVDKAGNLWVADRSWLPGQPVTPGTTPWGYVGGIGRVVSAPINNTEDDKLYQSERLYTGAAKPGYKFVVPNGRYMLTFKYAETYWTAAGKRRFTVMAEKKICFSNYDPFIAAGGAKNKAAPDKVCYVDVLDGMLEIDFISVVGQAKADAIYIQQLYQ